MIVVAIIGVLAAVAVPAFLKYIHRSKTTEALTNLRKIYDGEVAYYLEEHVLSSGLLASKAFAATRSEPWDPPGIDKRPANWENIGWPAIKFSTDGPVYYSYVVETDNSDPSLRADWVPEYGYNPDWTTIRNAFLARAFGDLDGDGKLSEFARFGLVRAGKDEVEGMGGVYSLDPSE